MCCLITRLQESPCYRPGLTLSLIGSAAAVVAGTFLTLAALQILPSGVNAISQLGQLGHALAFGILGGGALVACLSLILKLSPRRAPPAITQRDLRSFDDTLSKIGTDQFKNAVESCQTMEELFNNQIVMGAIPFKDLPKNLLNEQALVRGEFKQLWTGEPYIACHLECISPKEKIAKALGKALPSDLTLCTAKIMFYKDQDTGVYIGHELPYTFHSTPLLPLFLNHTAFKEDTNEQRKQENARGFQLFKQLLCNGEGIDRRGLHWKFVSTSD